MEILDNAVLRMSEQAAMHCEYKKSAPSKESPIMKLHPIRHITIAIPPLQSFHEESLETHLASGKSLRAIPDVS